MNCKSGFDYKSLTIGIAILLLIFSGVLVTAHYFRFEIFLLTKRLQVARKHDGQFEHDVYISVCENHGLLISWIKFTLRPFLVAKDYNVYFHSIDGDAGVCKEEGIVSNISKSRNFLIILSTDYTKEDYESIWTNIEWKHAWNLFKEESRVRNLVIVNYDQLQTKVFPVGPLKAYLRLGLDIDFANKKHKLLREISERLGEPNHNCLSTREPSDEIEMIELDRETCNFAESKWIFETDVKNGVKYFSHGGYRPPMPLSIIDIY